VRKNKKGEPLVAVACAGCARTQLVRERRVVLCDGYTCGFGEQCAKNPRFVLPAVPVYEAIKRKDMPRLEQLLAPDYVLVTSARAADPMDRKSWLDLMSVFNVESFTIGDVVVRCSVPRDDAGEACDLAAISLVST
jgi:hypothetical protein